MPRQLLLLLFFFSCEGIDIDSHPGSPVDFATQGTVSTDKFMAISAGWAHICGIKEDGTVSCWGNADFGKTIAPTGTFTAISAGSDFTCGILTDKRVSCWGNAADGRTCPNCRK